MPEGVREGREHLLKPQLRRLITTLSGYDISDDELLKLYNRFDNPLDILSKILLSNWTMKAQGVVMV